MNIIKYHIDENKLRDLIARGYKKNLKDMYLCMNQDTMNYIKASAKAETLQCKLNENASYMLYYDGILVVATDQLEFGEVKLFGFEDKPCTRIIIYTDGTTKTETNTTDKILVYID